MENVVWKKCSSCKTDIRVGQSYYICSVSTCNNLRTGLAFCSVACWERHLPIARHRDAGAIEKKAVAEAAPKAEGVRRIVRSESPQKTEKDILIIASKLKDYIRLRADMNTSASVMDVLSDKVRDLADAAIDRARAEGRKTVLDRDFE